MSVTYQTNNRLRRKVMTAPLSLPDGATEAVAETPEPMVLPRARRWPVVALGFVAALAATAALLLR